MQPKKIFVIGQGSIGKRHIFNLKALSQEVSVFSYRRSEGKNYEYLENINYVNSLTEGLSNSDAVIICNRTDQHIATALEAAKNKKHILVEKPLSNNLNDVEKLRESLKRNNLVFNPGFMLRFHPNLIFVKKLIDDQFLGDIYHANAQVGQYLPDWRPDTDYRNNYGAKLKWGGGVTLDLIHEIDLLHWFFGEVDNVSAMLGYTPKLGIETETISCINMRTKSNIICNIELDYLSPILRRKLEIVGEKGIINWDFLEGKVTFSSKNKRLEIIHQVEENFERNDMYLSEIKFFLNSINNHNSKVNGFDAAVASLKTAIAAINSHKKQKNVSPLDL